MSVIPWITEQSSRALSYAHPNIWRHRQTDTRSSVEVCKLKACRVFFPWNDNCDFVFFFFCLLFFSVCVKGEEAAGNQRLSKSKKWYCHTSRMAVWCLFKRGGKKKNSPGDWIISSCQYVLAFPPPSLQQHVLFSAVLFSVTHIPEPCAAQLGLRCPKRRPSDHKKCSCNPPETLLGMYFIYMQYCCNTK